MSCFRGRVLHFSVHQFTELNGIWRSAYHACIPPKSIANRLTDLPFADKKFKRQIPPRSPRLPPRLSFSDSHAFQLVFPIIVHVPGKCDAVIL